MQTSHDIIILGGGCAGLSLATRLSTSAPSAPQVVVVEQRERYFNDRTWCFWADRTPERSPLVTHSWSKFSVRNGARAVVCDSEDRPYQMIPSLVFYRQAESILTPSTNVDLQLGVRVLTEPIRQGGVWSVETSAGTLSAPRIIDTRPRRELDPDAALLWQSFYGSEVSAEHPVFDPSTVELMDFQLQTDTAIGFLYVLPFSTQRALVEFTVFDRERWPIESLKGELSAALRRRAGATVADRSEHGFLPMGLLERPQPGPAGYVRAGVTSGAARPSSGYAFQRIQRWADLCAKRLLAGEVPAGHRPDPPLLRMLDSLFLSVLRHQPRLGPEIFLALHQKASTRALLRFMTDQGSLLDYARIAGSLPFSPFLREIPRAILHRIDSTPAPRSTSASIPVLARGRKL